MSSGSFRLSSLRAGKIEALDQQCFASCTIGGPAFLLLLLLLFPRLIFYPHATEAGGIQEDGFDAIYPGWVWSEVFWISAYKAVLLP
ncbi:hypothetical protein C4D60_Mb03t01160 [Musa balbisiana]|uniref:Uncharacterized protein n=1 Tax=Musa balbisiana TaxID=52838 RepID=A0A4V4H5T0_MUSBA|nr:hypothetical protein C4D60_Mb03t01160 [Musa balbisiana]